MQRKTLRLFWQTAMNYPIRTWVALLGSSFTVFVGGFVAPFIIAQLLELLQANNLSFSTGLPWLIAYTIAQIYGQIIGGRINLFFTWTMETAGMRDLLARVMIKLTDHSLDFHANRFGGSLVSQTSKLSGAFERFWDTVIWQLVPGVVSIIAGVTILAFTFWQYAIALAIISLTFMVVVYLGSRSLREANRAEAQAFTTTMGHVADVVTNISAVKAFGYETNEHKLLRDKANNFREKSLVSMRKFLKVSTAYSSLITLLYVAAFVAAIWASEHSIISIASVYLAVTYTFTIGRHLWDMNSILRNFYRQMGDAHDMVEILSMNTELNDLSTKKLHLINGSVEFANVRFTHKGTTKPLFNDFNLTIPAGQRVGIVGHSGSGKTTLTRILLRFSDIEEGSILLDTQDISKVTQESLHRNVAYVPQEPLLFHRSLEENIAYGKPSATLDEIKKAAKKANATEFIDELKDGYDTLVGERGVKLSGGQRQRIAIARAILKDAPILVLDEATSALDSESEKLIQDALQKLMKGRTSIVIAHRLSTIAKLDRIIVMDNGKIVEDGTHQELLEKGGTYATLWSHQSGGFIEE